MKYKKNNIKLKRKITQSAIKFEINSMDPLGQGVAIIDKKPCFIPKTLPGETGTATLTKASKGVKFARLEALDTTADNRKSSECEHFDNCPGCHYLHTDYKSELSYKTQALKHHLERFDVDIPEIVVSPAKKRLGYRNRVQLHYRHKYIGMMDGTTNNVVEIPKCLLLNKELKTEFDRLYDDKSWAEDHATEGHCELFLTESGVGIEWDKPYAHGGFSQVNSAMNEVLKTAVFDEMKNNNILEGVKNTLLDLFSGDGNLSNMLVTENLLVERVMVDFAPDRVNLEELNFVHLDLFSETALRTFRARSEYSIYDMFIVDPPRKGFTDLHQWANTFNPKQIVYVSCNAATMVRDLQKLVHKYTIKKIHLIDLFPGTYHYETVITLSLT